MSKNKKEKSIESAAQAGAAYEVVDRYGSAAKEHLVAYGGVDRESGKQLKRGLKRTAGSKVNPDYVDQNIKQQAGFAAEDKYTARQNAEKIIKGEKERVVRTDDMGRVNDPLFDHVCVDGDGIVIPGTGEQMKFVGSNPKECLNKLESEKFQKYLDADATITVPSDYYDGIISEIDSRIQSLESQKKYAQDNGNKTLADSIDKKIQKEKKIRASVKDSGITNEEAVYARLHPKLSTVKDIAKLSHRAGIEQAKYGAAISGGFSLIRNVVAVAKGEKDATAAAKDFVIDTGTGAVASYVTAFAGTSIKATMQNANSSAIRALSKTNAPAAMVTSAIDVSKSMVRYIRGEISGTDCLIEIGEKGAGNLSAAMFAVAGQALIPIPVVGAMVGSMIGYALSSTFYKELVNSLKQAKLSHENRIRIERECAESIALIEKYRSEMNKCAGEYLARYNAIFDEAFVQMDDALITNDINQFLSGANTITKAFGGRVRFETKGQFDNFMMTKESFEL